MILLDSPIERAQAGSGSCLANRKLGNHGSRDDQPFEENGRNESKSGFFGLSCFETIQPSHHLYVSKKSFWNRFLGPWRILEIPEISEPPATPEPGFPENFREFSRIFQIFQRSGRLRVDFRGFSKDFLCRETARDVIFL